MIRLLASPTALRLAWSLLHFLWQGLLLGLLAWLTLTLLRRRSPQARYLVGLAFLAACLAAPLGTYSRLKPTDTTPSAARVIDTARPLPDLSAPALPPLQAGPPARPWQARLQPLLPWVVLSWVAGVLLLSLRAAGGWLWLRRLKTHAQPIPDERWQARLRRLASQCGLSRAVRFLESARVSTPLCMGLLRPVILVPLGFFAQLDPMAVEAILAHELAHLRRFDGLVNGAQCLIEVLLFFHPAVWWLSRRIRTEREHCCDDAAVLACGDAVLYAETLSRLDALRERPLSLALSARGGNLMERIRRLLLADPAPIRLAPAGLTLVAAFGLCATLVATQTEKPAVPAPATPVVAVATPALAPKPMAEKAPSAVISVEGGSLFETLNQLAAARRLDLVIDTSVRDAKGPFAFRHTTWEQALDSLLKANHLDKDLQGGVLRVAWADQMRSERAHVQPVAVASPAPAPAAELPPWARERRIYFRYSPKGDTEGALFIEARQASREEILAALQKIDRLAKSMPKDKERLDGEWALPLLKDAPKSELHTFKLDNVTPSGVKALYQ